LKKIFFVILIIIFSCKSNRNDRRVTYRFKKLEKDALFKFTEIGFNLYDTLIENNEEKGEFIFVNQLQDTIEITEKDSRFISVLIWVSSQEKDISIKQIDTFSLEIKKLRDTIKHPFSIIPNFAGLNQINIDISENVFLYSKKYRKNGKNRLLKNTYSMEYPIYTKLIPPRSAKSD